MGKTFPPTRYMNRTSTFASTLRNRKHPSKQKQTPVRTHKQRINPIDHQTPKMPPTLLKRQPSRKKDPPIANPTNKRNKRQTCRPHVKSLPYTTSWPSCTTTCPSTSSSFSTPDTPPLVRVAMSPPPAPSLTSPPDSLSPSRSIPPLDTTTSYALAGCLPGLVLSSTSGSMVSWVPAAAAASVSMEPTVPKL